MMDPRIAKCYKGGGDKNLKTATNNTTDLDSLPTLSDVFRIEYLMFTTLHPMRSTLVENVVMHLNIQIWKHLEDSQDLLSCCLPFQVLFPFYISIGFDF